MSFRGLVCHREVTELAAAASSSTTAADKRKMMARSCHIPASTVVSLATSTTPRR